MADEKEIQRVYKLIKDNNIKFVDLRFIDMPGIWQHFSVPAGELFEADGKPSSIWAEAIGFDGSSIRGFQSIHESDMLLYLDPTTAIVDPVLEVPTVSIVCDVFDPISKKPYSRIRGTLRKKPRNT